MQLDLSSIRADLSTWAGDEAGEQAEQYYDTAWAALGTVLHGRKGRLMHCMLYGGHSGYHLHEASVVPAPYNTWV